MNRRHRRRVEHDALNAARAVWTWSAICAALWLAFLRAAGWL